MKCIKVVRETKENKIGTIRRVADSEADTKVSSKVWAFCPKSEWKLATRTPKSVQVSDQVTEQIEELSIEEKKLARKKKNK
jgi:hypothetical protein